MDWKFLFLSAEGRIGQRDFWLAMLMLFAANIVSGFVPVLGQLVMLAILFASVCVTSKRLHDFGKSGWLQLVPLGAMLVLSFVAAAIIGVGAFASSATGNSGMMFGASWFGASIAALLMFLVGIGFLLWVGLSKGDAGPNRFGPPQTVSAFTAAGAGAASPTTGNVTPTTTPAPPVATAETETTLVHPKPPEDHV